MRESYIEIKDVTKRFGQFTVLDQVSVSFAEGQIHGLIGRNGSGKTVLMKCICGFMAPTSGSITVAGRLVKPGMSPNVGIILEEPGFISSMSGFKNLMLLAEIKGKIGKDNVRQAIRFVGLDPDLKKPVRTYSLGMRHRLAIAQAIMEEPPLLVLDEPMNGLDKAGVMQMRELFADLRKQGKTIIISSHHTEDIESLCDTVCEMDHGNLEMIAS